MASTVGLYVGWILAFVLLVFNGNVLGIEYCDACDRLAFGIGLGTGIGVLQWLVLRRRISRVGWWVLASFAGGYGIMHAGFTGYTESFEMSSAELLGLTGVRSLEWGCDRHIAVAYPAGAGLPSWLVGVSKHRGLGIGDSTLEGRRR